jgi:hypothetical protein
MLYSITRACNYFAQYTEPLLIKKRLYYGAREKCTNRFFQLRDYKNNKLKKIIYSQNMKLMAELSEEKNIPQHKLRELFDSYADNTILSYTDNDYLDGAVQDIHYYIHEIRKDLKSLCVFIKEKIMDGCGEEIQYKTLRFILVRLRCKTYKQNNLILNKWYAIRFYRNQRLRREKQIRYYKSLKNRLHTKTTDTTIQEANI